MRTRGATRATSRAPSQAWPSACCARTWLGVLEGVTLTVVVGVREDVGVLDGVGE
jgi:hypothetical protein